MTAGCGGPAAPSATAATTAAPTAASTAASTDASTPSTVSRTAASGPPRAPVRPVTETLHGISITDPYRYLERMDDPEVATWMRAQDDFARAHLAKLPHREELRQRISALLADILPAKRLDQGGRTQVFLRREPGSEVDRVYLRDRTTGTIRLLFDPDAVRGDAHHVNVDAMALSPDARHVALALAKNGSEDGVLRIVRTSDGTLLDDVVPRIVPGTIRWLDAKTVTYSARSAEYTPERPMELWRNRRLRLHEVGADAARDVTALAPGVDPSLPLDEIEGCRLVTHATSPHLLAACSRGTRSDVALWIAPKAGFRPGQGGWRKLTELDDNVRSYALHGNELYLVTVKNAPFGKLLRLSLTAPRLAAAETLSVGTAVGVLESVSTSAEGAYAVARSIVDSRVSFVPHGAGQKLRPVPLPEGANVFVSAQPDEPGARLLVSSWTEPPRWLELDGTTGRTKDIVLSPPLHTTLPSMTTETVWAPSADGTKVPLTIVRSREFVADGSHPTYLTAYGAYGMRTTPSFSLLATTLVERGGVFASCHVRGGGELGEEWRLGGFQETKHHTWEDAIGCAEWLVAHGYTSPAHLGLSGTSAGGIMVGNAILARPDLFAAAFLRVGVMNPLRIELAPAGPPNALEYGTRATPEGLRSLLGMDSYSKVKDGTRFPATLVEGGLTDPRVPAWEPAKMAARMQAANGGDAPVLLRIEREAGHGVGSSRTQLVDMQADELAFLLAYAGEKPPRKPSP